ncbi:PTS sugar transporter subunit IIA, partial [Balneolaceae bacterium ANBcel3]|nr:PTS sugar transporter subunit IIA [Balneolaceae bacterium ANBcel3]
NLIIVYPAEVEEHHKPTAVLRFDESPILPDISANQIYIADENESSHSNAIEKIVQSYFPERSDVATEIMQKLKSIDPDNLPGDIPGVLLSPLRSHYVDKPVLLLAINEKGFHVKKIGESVKIMFILLTPTHISTQRSLLILSRLGRLIGKKEIKEKLPKAKNIDEIRKILSARLSILPAENNADEKKENPTDTPPDK